MIYINFQRNFTGPILKKNMNCFGLTGMSENDFKICEKGIQSYMPKSFNSAINKAEKANKAAY